MKKTNLIALASKNKEKVGISLNKIDKPRMFCSKYFLLWKLSSSFNS